MIALILAVGGWLGAFGLGVFDALMFSPSDGNFAPSWLLPTVILLMGVAIASGAALGRVRSVETLSKVFHAGQIAADDEKEPNDRNNSKH